MKILPPRRATFNWTIDLLFLPLLLDSDDVWDVVAAEASLVPFEGTMELGRPEIALSDVDEVGVEEGTTTADR